VRVAIAERVVVPIFIYASVQIRHKSAIRAHCSGRDAHVLSSGRLCVSDQFRKTPVSFYLADDARTTNEFGPLPGEIIHKLLFIYSSSEAMLRCTFPLAPLKRVTAF
jgi:hypothetical protein